MAPRANSLGFGLSDSIQLYTSDLEAIRDKRGVTITLATDSKSLGIASAIRRKAYAKHKRPILPQQDSDIDRQPQNAVLLARDAFGQPSGTMRVSVLLDGTSKWTHGVTLPESYRSKRTAFFERLAIVGTGRTAIETKQQLFKAAYLLSVAIQCEQIVIATLPPLQRLFEGIGFCNVFGEDRRVAVNWHPDTFFVLAMDITEAGIVMLKSNPAWYAFSVTRDDSMQSAIAGYFDRNRVKSSRAVAVDPRSSPIGLQLLSV